MFAHGRGGQWAFVSFTGHVWLSCNHRRGRRLAWRWRGFGFSNRSWHSCRCSGCRCSHRRYILGVTRAFHFNADQNTAHGHDFTRLAAEGNHFAVHRRGNVHHRLIGHHIRQHLVFNHQVADLYVPYRQFNFCDAFPNVRHLDYVRPHSDLHDPFQRRAHTGRPWEIRPLLRVRVGRVPAGDAFDRRFQVMEAMLLHQRHQLGTKTAGARGFVHHHATAGLFHRLDDGFQVQRPQAAQVDDLSVDTGFFGGNSRHIHGGAVGQHRDGRARTHDRGDVQRHGVVTIRDLRLRVFRPRRYRAVVVAVERAVVQAFGLEEDHRVVVFDRGNQQAFGVIRVGRHHRAQAADLGEHRFDTLAVGLAAIDAAAAGHAHGQRRSELTGRAITQARSFGDDLVGRGVDVVGELDFCHRAQAVGTHAHCHTDDAAFGNRRVEYPRAAVLVLQALGATEHAAEVTDVLAEYHHVVVTLKHHVHGRAQGLDHGHGGGGHGGFQFDAVVVIVHVRPPTLDAGASSAPASLYRRLRTWSRRLESGRRRGCRTVRLLSGP